MTDYCADVFQVELNQIGNHDVRSFVEDALRKAPAYFWRVSSSTSGKTHPPDERCEGGRVLHTKRVVRVVQEIARIEDHPQMYADLLIGAALIHDLVVNGTDDTPIPRMWSEHDIALRPYLGGIVEEHGSIAHQILLLCESHMGRWASIAENRPVAGSIAHLLHLADVIASRSWITVNPMVGE